MRIWFNRGFSLAPIAAAMRAADPDLDVCISVSGDHPQYPGPSETWIEPEGDSAAYVDWVRETIREQRIDLFIPTRRRAAIAAAALECRVEIPAALPVLQLLEDKYAFAEALADEPFHLPTGLAGSSAALAEALADFAGLPCVKPRTGVNGTGFWTLMRDAPLSHLLDPDARFIRADLYLAALRAEEADKPIQELVVMDYLPGPEVSFDILADRGMLLKYAARTKLPNGNQRIETAHPLAGDVARLVARFGLHGIVNAQFRRDRLGAWKLLEINARPAGGIVYAEQVGCGLIADWTRLLTGRIVPAEVTRPAIDTEIRFGTSIHAVGAP